MEVLQMKLQTILNKIDYTTLQGDVQVNIESVAYHSGLIQQDSLFICLEGTKRDGHDYIAQAVMKGAVAIVIQKQVGLEFVPDDMTVIQVDDTRHALPIIASQFYSHPSQAFRLVGVTGTNGKTSVSHLISSILQYTGRKVGTVGTLGNRINNEDIKAYRTTPTTPETVDLQASFAAMRNQSVTDVVMEVSSMGLKNKRVLECQFDVGIFTNLSQEHLEEHGSFEDYKENKLSLFPMCPYSILNIDDPFAPEFIGATNGSYETYGIENKEADLNATNIKSDEKGVHFQLNHREFQKDVYVPVPGEFTVSNSLAAISCCLHLGIDIGDIIESLNHVKGPDGRLQTIHSPEGYTVMVDYAHTPDALEKVLLNLSPIKKGNIFVVFGCGGDRDRGKRAVMGEIASRWSDYVILTTDNPRSEEPSSILSDVEEGMQAPGDYEIIEDREEAIHRALGMAEPRDIVVIAGRGNENYQEVNGSKRSLNDFDVVERFMNQHTSTIKGG